MPETMLKKMLFALCRSGAEFCHAETAAAGLSRGPEAVAFATSQDPGFSRLIAGGGRYRPSGEGNEPYYPPERHPGHVEIILVLEGCVDFLVNGRWCQLTPGRVHILLPGTLHTERHVRRAPYTLLWLSCLPSLLTLHRTAFSPDSGYAQSACRVAIAPPMSRALWDCGVEKAPDEAHFFSLLLQCLDFSVAQGLAEQSTGDYHHSILEQIREYLLENFSRPVTLWELSQMAHCSAIHLNRLFRQRCGVSIHQYLCRLRLEKAKELLLRGLPPGDVARSIGVPDQRYFSRFFRRHTGVTPSEYRQQASSFRR